MKTNYRALSINLGSFFSYVSSLMAMGLVLCGTMAFATGYGLLNIILSSNGMSGTVVLLGLLVLSAIGSSVTNYMLQSGIQSNSVSKSLVLFVFSSLCSGLSIAPIFTMGFLYGFTNIVIAFAMTIVFFGVLSVYASVSNRDFSPLRGVLTIGIFLLFGLFILKFVVSFFSPIMSESLDLFGCVVGLLLSMGLTLYEVSALKQMVAQYGDGSRTTMNLGIMGASMLLQTAVMMFVYIWRLLESNNRRRS